MALGGYRPGAGRKKGFAALAAERTRIQVAKMVEEEIIPLTKAQIEKAKKGDSVAYNALMNRAFGMPRQNLGLDGGDDGEPVTFKDVAQMSSKEVDEYLREKLAGSSN